MIRTGIDLLRIDKIEKMLESDLAGLLQLFTDSELENADRSDHKARYLAARFACKEAVFKCMDIEMRIKYLKEIEIINNERGRPIVKLYGNMRNIASMSGVKYIDVSISYEDEYVIANAVAEL